MPDLFEMLKGKTIESMVAQKDTWGRELVHVGFTDGTTIVIYPETGQEPIWFICTSTNEDIRRQVNARRKP